MTNNQLTTARVAAAAALAAANAAFFAAKRAAKAAALSPEQQEVKRAAAERAAAAAADQWAANTETPAEEVILSPEQEESRRIAHRARVDAANAEREAMLASRVEAAGGDLLRWMTAQAQDARWSLHNEEDGNNAYLALEGAMVAHLSTGDVPHGTMGRHATLEAIAVVRALLERHTTVEKWVANR